MLLSPQGERLGEGAAHAKSGETDGLLSRPTLPADGAHPVRDVDPDLRHAAPGAGQHRRHPGRCRGHRRPQGEGQDRQGARARPADHRAVRPVDRRADARRSRLRLRLGAAGDRGDRAAHPDQRQAAPDGAVLLGDPRRAVRRDQRGAAEHDARLFPARPQSQRAVAAVLLARPAGPDGVRALVRHDPDLHQRAAQLPAGGRAARPSRPPWSASEVRR